MPSSICLRDVPGSIAFLHFASVVAMLDKEVSASLKEILLNGRFLVLAPEGVRAERLKDFQTGGLLSEGEYMGTYQPKDGMPYRMVGVRDTSNELVEFIRKEIAGEAGYTIILFEPYYTNRTGSDVLKELKFQMIENISFGMASVDELDANHLAKAISIYTMPWFSLLCLTREKSFRNLRTTLSGARITAVGAYDGESYVVWNRQ